MHSLAEVYLHMLPPQGHSTVGVPKRCEGFVAIWLHAHARGVRGQPFSTPLYIYIYIYIYIIIYVIL